MRQRTLLHKFQLIVSHTGTVVRECCNDQLCICNSMVKPEIGPFSTPKPHNRQQFQSGLKTHLFKRSYIWLLPPRTIEEWTYLLTYLTDRHSSSYFKDRFWLDKIFARQSLHNGDARE